MRRRRSGLAPMGLLLMLAGCRLDAAPLTDRDALIHVVRSAEAGDSVRLTVTVRRAALQLNAKAPPRFTDAEGTEYLLRGAVDASGEKFVGAASVLVPRGAGTLQASVCDSAVGICRSAAVQLER